MATYIIEKRELGSNWYRYSSTGSEYAATITADSAKKAFPNCTFRVLDGDRAVVYIT